MMKRLIFFLAVLSLVFCTAGAGASDTHTFKITRVYDGDTVMAVRDGVVIYVMLMGIDAPEISETSRVPDQPFGREAKRYLSNLILNREVEIEGYGRGPYPDNNILGVIFLNGKNVNLEMVRKGLAEAFEKDLPPNFDITPFVEAERKAKQEKAGIWSLGKRYISPSRWREMHKLNLASGP
ncbi:MAG: nuclease [Deltaproteobacteria bacterium]|nr:MAG: nuclease [Deltaproteobacteria bacterium]